MANSQRVDTRLPPALWVLGTVLDGEDLLALDEDVAGIRSELINAGDDANGSSRSVVGRRDDPHPPRRPGLKCRSSIANAMLLLVMLLMTGRLVISVLVGVLVV